MRRPSSDRALAWVVLAGLCFMLPRASAYSIEQLQLLGALWGKSVEARGELAADEHTNPLSYAGAVRTRQAADRARRAGRVPKSPLPGTWHWAYATGQELSPQDRVFMNAPHFPAYVYGNFFFYPAPLYMESAGKSIVDHETMKTRGRYLPVTKLRELRAAGFTHALIAPAPGRLRLVELPGRPKP